MAQLLQNDPGFEAFLNQQVGNGTTWGDYMSMPMPDAYALERQYRQQQAAQQAQKQAPVQQPVQDPWASVGGRNFDSATGTFRNTGHTIADLDRAIQAQQAVRQQQAQTPVVKQGGTGSVRNGRGAVRNGKGSRGGTGTTPPAQPTAPTYDSNWVNGNYGDIVALSKQLAEAERKQQQQQQQPTEQKTSKPAIAPDGYMEGFDDISELPVGRSAQISKSVPVFAGGYADVSDDYPQRPDTISDDTPVVGREYFDDPVTDSEGLPQWLADLEAQRAAKTDKEFRQQQKQQQTERVAQEWEDSWGDLEPRSPSLLRKFKDLTGLNPNVNDLKAALTFWPSLASNSLLAGTGKATATPIMRTGRGLNTGTFTRSTALQNPFTRLPTDTKLNQYASAISKLPDQNQLQLLSRLNAAIDQGASEAMLERIIRGAI